LPVHPEKEPTLTTRTFHDYRPCEGHRLAHDPLNSIIAPRPIGWVGTLGKDGVPNLAPFSFFNLLSYRPPILGFAPDYRADTLRNARETGEFTWNLVTRALAEKMNLTSSPVPPHIDEFDLAGLEPLASVDINAPRVAASPIQMECKVTKIVELRGHGGTPGTHHLVLGEIVHVHIDPEFIAEGIYQTSRAAPILRSGGPADYFGVTDETCFKMPRPGKS
jgi:flavin reductase (DIM6/NTAB) family NADH-FMN oxidoreductase RutF